MNMDVVVKEEWRKNQNFAARNLLRRLHTMVVDDGYEEDKVISG